MEPFIDLARLSLNQVTTQRWSLREAIEGCARAGIPAIGVWRDKLAEIGLAQATRLVRDAGLRVSSVCRGGMFPATTAAERRARIEENRRAVDEAGYTGPIEVEVFSDEVWALPGEEIIAGAVAGYLAAAKG